MNVLTKQQGLNGYPGEEGALGPKGFKGEAIITEINRINKGEAGEPGRFGLPGMNGSPGEPGERGAAGLPGLNGQKVKPSLCKNQAVIEITNYLDSVICNIYAIRIKELKQGLPYHFGKINYSLIEMHCK